MPPVALTCLKYAVEPQLSLSPICAYTPESASSLQTTMGVLEAAELPPPPPPPLHAASAPATSAAPAAAAILNVTRLRIIVLPFWNLPLTTGLFCGGPSAADEQRVDDGGGPEVGRAAVEDEVAAGQDEDPLADLGHQGQVVLDEQHAGALGQRDEQRGQPLPLLLGQAGGRLVEQQQPR